MKRILTKSTVYIAIFALLVCAFLFIPQNDVEYAEAAYDFSKVGVSALPQGFPNDLLWYDSAEYLDIVGLRAIVRGWAEAGELPDPTSADFEPIKICVVDTGISIGHELYEGLYCYDAQGNRLTYDSYRDVESPTAAADCDDHGSHVNGSISILIKELGLQDYIKILPVKATSTVTYSHGVPTYTFNVRHVAKAMEWGERNGASIYTMSLGGAGELGGSVWKNGYFTSVVERLSADSLIFAAAGNDGTDSAVENHYPSALDGFISIMAYTQNSEDVRRLASFSNFGDYHIAAPGTSIYSAVSYDDALNESEYGNKQGTSMATPIAAAAGALLQLRYRYVESETPSGYLLTRAYIGHSTTDITAMAGRTGAIPAAKALDVKRLLTVDFDFAEMYAEPTALSATVSGILNQNPSTLSPVVFSAKYSPLGVNPETAIDWYLNDEKVASGDTYTFTPSQLGSYEIYASSSDLSLSTDRYTVKLAYAPVLVSDCSVAPVDSVLHGDTTKIVLSGAEGADVSTIYWYVDGKQVAQGVTEYNLTTPRSGSYDITVKIGENEQTFTVELTPDYSTAYKYFAICGGGLAFLAVVGGVMLSKSDVKKMEAKKAKAKRNKRK